MCIFVPMKIFSFIFSVYFFALAILPCGDKDHCLGEGKSTMASIQAGDCQDAQQSVDGMKKNSDITIELISHTDSRGTSEFNMEPSQKRATTAVDYIIAKGIDKKRLAAKGKGESQLTNRCKDGVDCSEEEHAQNRRTEFKVKKGKE